MSQHHNIERATLFIFRHFSDTLAYTDIVISVFTHIFTHLGRGTPVSLLVTESTGALSTDMVRMLLALAKQARAPTTHDSTCYGTARTSPRSYFAHHTAAISAAIVFADATSIMHAAAAMSFL